LTVGGWRLAVLFLFKFLKSFGSLKNISTFAVLKNLRQCQRERFNHRKGKEKINTVLLKEWLQPMAVRY